MHDSSSIGNFSRINRKHSCNYDRWSFIIAAN